MTATPTEPVQLADLDHVRSHPSRVALAILALAAGGFTIGTTEFVTMGLLPEIAEGVAVSIPVAGHAISAYAVGVVVGVPLLVIFGSRLPRRGLLIGLMATYAAFNALTALAPTFPWLVAARFLDGLPHGGYFGVASLVAADLAAPSRKGRAIASVMLGLSVANVVGVPAATWLGQQLGWRSAFVVVAVLAMITAMAVLAFVPSMPSHGQAGARREMAAFRSGQVWLTLAAGAVGFGGMFAVYSYIAPTVTVLGGLSAGAVPVFLLALGLGMVVGTWLAGELADWSVFRSLLGASVGMALVLLLFAAVAPYGWWLLPVGFLVTATSSVLVVNLQLRLMSVATDAPTLGAAMNHASLNVANALGAWLGALVLAAGYGYRAPALVGVALSLLGLVILIVSALRHRSARWTQAARSPVR